MRLIPADRNYGWTPYVWLIYIVGFFAYPFFDRSSPWRIAATIAAGLLFLVLYFVGHWVHGRALLAVIAALTLLGVVFVPFNPGAPALFIYAAAFAGGMSQPRRGMWVVGGVLAVLLLEVSLLHIEPWRWWWGALFTLVVGGVNVHYAQVARQNARLRLAQEEVEHLAKVAERERIARDLHDLLGHTLSLIILKSELASKLSDRDPARARDEIRDVERISREALAEVRSAVSGYRSGGLQNELTKAKEALETADLEVDCAVETPPLAPAQEVVLALAVREAVTNIIRHAKARRCTIRLARHGEVCRLTVADDGRGGIAADGFGLAGMRERVASLGGRFRHEYSHGTTLTIELPLPPAAVFAMEQRA
jgi:two-component system sensor histidine kinase DesK